MEKYRYSAVDESGNKVSGTETAASRSAAHLALLERGYQTIDVSEKKSILQFEITKKLVPRKDVMHFSRQLSVFVKAGIPIMEALEVIAEETTDKLLQEGAPRHDRPDPGGRHLRLGRRRASRGLPQLLRRHAHLGRADRKPRHRPRPAG